MIESAARLSVAKISKIAIQGDMMSQTILVSSGLVCFLVAALLFLYQLRVFAKSPDRIQKNFLGTTHSLTTVNVLQKFSVTLSTNWVSVLFLVPSMLLFLWGFAARNSDVMTTKYVTIFLGIEENEIEPELVAGWNPDFGKGEVSVVVNGESSTMHSAPDVSADGVVTIRFQLGGDDSFTDQIQAISYTVESYEMSAGCTSLRFASGSLMPFQSEPIGGDNNNLRYQLKLRRGVKSNDACPLAI